MNPTSVLKCLLVLGCAAGLSASERDALIDRGKTGRPFFDARGQARIVYTAADGRTLLESPADVTQPPRVIRDCGPDRTISSLRTKKDGLQRSWIVWEEKTAAGSGDIFIGRAADEGLIDIHHVSRGFEGRNHAPDLDVTPGMQPFTVWIQTRGAESRLMLKSFFPERTWVVRISPEGSLFTPRILADAESRIWIFWVEAADGPDEIFSARLEGGVLTHPVSLTPGTGVPHFHPAAGRDPRGRPLLAWASYDGSDYQIHIRGHNGTHWLPPRKLTDVKGTANVQPSVSLLVGSIPVVAWLRDHRGVRDILLSYREAEKEWSPAFSIAGETEGLDGPALAAEGDRLAVSWESGDGWHMKTLALADLRMRKTPLARKPAASVPTGFLADDAFIAFGDSITYGILLPPWDIKELGYPPRLQVLLENIYENPDVINRGVPADDTWGGLSRIVDVITDDLALYLLLKEGTNDVSGESYSMITTAFNLSEMVAKCRQHGVFPLLSTIIPRKGPRWDEFAISRTYNLNNRIRRICLEQNVLLVDMFDIFFRYPEELGGWQSLIADAPDNLHPSLKGYQHMAESWYNHIERIPFPPVSAAARRMMKDGVMELTWEKDPKITSDSKLFAYKILRKWKTENAFREIGLVPSSRLSFLDENPEFSSEPIYALRAVTTSGLEGPVSAPVFPVQGDPHPPLDVTSRTVANKALLFTEYINIVSWADNPANAGVFDISRYRVYRKRAGDAPDRYTLIGEFAPHLRECLDRRFPSAAEAEQYVYGVSAVDRNGVEGLLGKPED